MTTKLYSKSRLWDVGKGTGKYAPSQDGRSETDIVNDMIKAVKKAYIGQPIKVLKTHGGFFQASGLPDIYVQLTCPIWIEVKLPGGDTTKLQRDTLINLKEAGAYVGVAETVEEFMDTIKEALFLESKRVLYATGESVHYDI